MPDVLYMDIPLSAVLLYCLLALMFCVFTVIAIVVPYRKSSTPKHGIQARLERLYDDIGDDVDGSFSYSSTKQYTDGATESVIPLLVHSSDGMYYRMELCSSTPSRNASFNSSMSLSDRYYSSITDSSPAGRRRLTDRRCGYHTSPSQSPSQYDNISSPSEHAREQTDGHQGILISPDNQHVLNDDVYQSDDNGNLQDHSCGAVIQAVCQVHNEEQEAGCLENQDISLLQHNLGVDVDDDNSVVDNRRSGTHSPWTKLHRNLPHSSWSNCTCTIPFISYNNSNNNASVNMNNININPCSKYNQTAAHSPLIPHHDNMRYSPWTNLDRNPDCDPYTTSNMNNASSSRSSKSQSTGSWSSILRTLQLALQWTEDACVTVSDNSIEDDLAGSTAYTNPTYQLPHTQPTTCTASSSTLSPPPSTQSLPSTPPSSHRHTPVPNIINNMHTQRLQYESLNRYQNHQLTFVDESNSNRTTTHIPCTPSSSSHNSPPLPSIPAPPILHSLHSHISSPHTTQISHSLTETNHVCIHRDVSTQVSPLHSPQHHNSSQYDRPLHRNVSTQVSPLHSPPHHVSSQYSLPFIDILTSTPLNRILHQRQHTCPALSSTLSPPSTQSLPSTPPSTLSPTTTPNLSPKSMSRPSTVIHRTLPHASPSARPSSPKTHTWHDYNYQYDDTSQIQHRASGSNFWQVSDPHILNDSYSLKLSSDGSKLNTHSTSEYDNLHGQWSHKEIITYETVL